MAMGPVLICTLPLLKLTAQHVSHLSPVVDSFRHTHSLPLFCPHHAECRKAEEHQGEQAKRHVCQVRHFKAACSRAEARWREHRGCRLQVAASRATGPDDGVGSTLGNLPPASCDFAWCGWRTFHITGQPGKADWQLAEHMYERLNQAVCQLLPGWQASKVQWHMVAWG